jgi:hypothetical protein
VQFWGKVEKKREKNEEQKYRQNPWSALFLKITQWLEF